MSGATSSDLMYSEIIMEYYRNPKQRGVLNAPDIHARDTNPSCGDVLEFFATVDDNKRITDIRFTGKGCAISQAAASMLAESLLGSHIDGVVHATKKDVLDLLGIPISPMRLKCALLGLKVLKVGTYAYLGRTFDEDVYEEANSEPVSQNASSGNSLDSLKFSSLEAPAASGAASLGPGSTLNRPSAGTTHSATDLTLSSTGSHVEKLREALRAVEDPEMHLDIVTLELIRDIKFVEGKADIIMTLTSPLCPFGQYIVNAVKETALKVPGVTSAEIALTFEPPWTPSEDVRMMLGV